MSNFALLPTDPTGDLISSINYLLATQGQGNGTGTLGNSLTANTTSGQITTTADPNYLAYLYQYVNVRYADSADGTVNFSTSPTNRLYFGVRNSVDTAASTNPADYVWTQAVGGFGTTKYLYYATIGGRQIQWSVGSTPPGTNFVITTDAQYIDLDVLSSSLQTTSYSVTYSNGSVFTKSTSNVWTPTSLFTYANIAIVRANTVVGFWPQQLYYYDENPSYWNSTNDPAQIINANAFTPSFANSSTTNYYQTFTYNDTLSNVRVQIQAVAIKSGQNGANGAAGTNGLTISTTYSGGQTFSKFVSNGTSSWVPAANAAGYVNTAATTTVYDGNVLVGRITRQLGYDSNSIFAGNISPNVSGNITSQTYVGNIRTPPLTTDYGRTIFTGNLGGYNYYTLLGASFSANNDNTQYHADYTVVVSGGGTYADIFLVGPGGYGGKNDAQGNPRTDGGGNGGEVKYYPNVYIPAGSYSLTVGGLALFATSPAQVLNTRLTIGGNVYQANAGGYTVGGAGTGAGGASPDGLQGGPGVPDPWGTVNWITDPLVRYTGSVTPGTYYTQGNIYYVDSITKQPMYFGGGGAYAVQNSTLNAYYAGGTGGGGSFLPNIGAGTGPHNGIYGGGGSAEGVLFTGGSPGGGGAAILRINANISTYGNLWVLSNNSISDVNSSRFTIGPGYSTTLSYYTPVTYSAANSSTVSSQIEVTVSPSTQGTNGATGSRGFIPLAYVVTASDPTSYTDAQYTTAFSAPRNSVVAPIGTGFAPVTGDTAQFIYTVTNAYVVKTFNSNSVPNWTTANGQVIDGNLIVTGTITAAQMNVNSLYTLSVQSTNATSGNTSSPGFWLQANTGDARFGGNVSIGANLNVAGLITSGNLSANTVGASQIQALTITAAKIAANTITNAQIAANTITNAQIAGNTITSLQIASRTISNAQIALGTISGDLVAANTLTGNLIASGTLTGNLLAVSTITGNLIAQNAITGNLISQNTITGNLIALNAITGNLIASSTITGNLIAQNTITGNLVALSTITGSLIVPGTITGNLIAANTITANNIAAGTITADKLAANAITANTVVSTGATLGSNTSPGFWLDGSTGNARFGGGLNVGNNLTVGNLIINSTLGNSVVGYNNLQPGIVPTPVGNTYLPTSVTLSSAGQYDWAYTSGLINGYTETLAYTKIFVTPGMAANSQQTTYKVSFSATMNGTLFPAYPISPQFYLFYNDSWYGGDNVTVIVPVSGSPAPTGANVSTGSIVYPQFGFYPQGTGSTVINFSGNVNMGTNMYSPFGSHNLASNSNVVIGVAVVNGNGSSGNVGTLAFTNINFTVTT